MSYVDYYAMGVGKPEYPTPQQIATPYAPPQAVASGVRENLTSRGIEPEEGAVVDTPDNADDLEACSESSAGDDHDPALIAYKASLADLSKNPSAHQTGYLRSQLPRNASPIKKALLHWEYSRIQQMRTLWAFKYLEGECGGEDSDGLVSINASHVYLGKAE